MKKKILIILAVIIAVLVLIPAVAMLRICLCS